MCVFFCLFLFFHLGMQYNHVAWETAKLGLRLSLLNQGEGSTHSSFKLVISTSKTKPGLVTEEPSCGPGFPL